MALTFTEITLRGKTQDALQVSGDDYILKNNLAPFDLEHLTAIEASIDSVEINNLLEALAAYTMPNGQTAATYYANFTIDIVEANADWVPYGNAEPWSEIKSLGVRVTAIEGDVSDLDGRVTAIENL